MSLALAGGAALALILDPDLHADGAGWVSRIGLAALLVGMIAAGGHGIGHDPGSPFLQRLMVPAKAWPLLAVGGALLHAGRMLG